MENPNAATNNQARRDIERRELPRFPIRRESIRFFYPGLEKVFALRDISLGGVGVELAEPGELLLLTPGLELEAELRLVGDAYRVKLTVQRVDAASAGCRFRDNSPELKERVQSLIDPLRIAASLRAIAPTDSVEAEREGVTHWYHGDLGTDLYLWLDTKKVPLRALLLWNSFVWEWSTSLGARSGRMVPTFQNKQEIEFDSSIQHATVYQARKILENAEVLDYGLKQFLLQQA